MSLLTWKIRNLFRNRTPQTTRKLTRRLTLEHLEERTVLSATASGVVSGVAFVDTNNNGVRDGQESGLAGVQLTLTGKTTQGVQVNTAATTDGQGAYNFLNVQPGTYHLSSAQVQGVVGSSADPSVFNFSVAGGQTVHRNVGFGGVQPQFISGRMFLDDSSDGSPFAAGSGVGSASSRANSTPTFIASQTANLAVAGTTTGTHNKVLDMSAFFTDPDITNSQVRFDTSSGPINVQLFDKQAPQTVANFFDYINSGSYNSSIFHRLVNNFVIQGGGYKLPTAPGTLPQAITGLFPPVPSEAGISNTAGTIAMALSGSDANSGTDEFFFNLVNNTSLNTGPAFTVFGQIVGAADSAVLTKLSQATINTKDTSPGQPFKEIPLNGYPATSPFPGTTTSSNFEVVKDVAIVRQDEALTYSIVSNTKPGSVSATLQNNYLKLNYTAPTGLTPASITIKATDKFGASVTATFTVTVT